MNGCNARAHLTTQEHKSLLIFCLDLYQSIPVYVTQVGLDLSYQVFTCIYLTAPLCVCVCVCVCEKECDCMCLSALTV